MNRMICTTVFCVVALLATTVTGGELSRAVKDMDSGTLHFDFEGRDGICGDGENYISINDDENHFVGCGNYHGDRWRKDCVEGPVHIELRIRDGRIRSIETTVGPAHDPDDYRHFLPNVDPQEAADFLLRVARTARYSVAEEAILPATLGRDVEVWDEILDIARDDDIHHEVRENAVFWLSQAAGEKATEGLEKLVKDDDEDLEVREAAVFGLSQRDTDVAVPALMEIAENNRHPQLRESALFWLGQQDDPRVLELFEEILLGD